MYKNTNTKMVCIFFFVVALQTSKVYAYKKLPMIKKNKLENKSHYFVEFKMKLKHTVFRE